jgi:hypothetical protein
MQQAIRPSALVPVPSENSIRPGIRIARQNHRMIGPTLAVLQSLGMFIVAVFKSRRRLEAGNLFLRHQLSIATRKSAGASSTGRQ